MRLFQSCLLLAVWMAVAPRAIAQDAPTPLPRVIQHADPVYPQIARTAHILGDVRVRFSTNGESVIQAVAESGPQLLRKSSEDDVRSWKFAAHTPGSFYVTFRYKLLSGDTEIAFLESPALVEVAAPVAPIIIDYAYIGLGKWKTDVKSAHGKSHLLLNLAYSGPDGTWLAGDARDAKGKCEEIDVGVRDGEMLGFTMALADPKGKEVKTFFVGKMTDAKIIGSLVDENGRTANWSASKTSEMQGGEEPCE